MNRVPIVNRNAMKDLFEENRKFLPDAVVLVLLAIGIFIGVFTWQSELLSRGNIEWGVSPTDYLELRHETLSWFAPLISLVYFSSVIGCWFALRCHFYRGSVAAALGFAIPILAAPLFPTVPSWWIPSCPVLMIPMMMFIYCLVLKRGGLALGLLFTTLAWVLVANTYETRWFVLFGD